MAAGRLDRVEGTADPGEDPIAAATIDQLHALVVGRVDLHHPGRGLDASDQVVGAIGHGLVGGGEGDQQLLVVVGREPHLAAHQDDVITVQATIGGEIERHPHRFKGSGLLSRRPIAGPQPQQGQAGAAAGLDGGGAENIEIDREISHGNSTKGR